MKFRWLIFWLVLLLLVPGVATAVDWNDLWTGSGRTSVRANSSAYIVVPTAVTDEDEAPILPLAAAYSTVCLNTDVATLGNGAGTVVIRLLWIADAADTVNAAIELTQLTSAVPCGYNVPSGRLLLKVETVGSAVVGQIHVRGH